VSLVVLLAFEGVVIPAVRLASGMVGRSKWSDHVLQSRLAHRSDGLTDCMELQLRTLLDCYVGLFGSMGLRYWSLLGWYNDLIDRRELQHQIVPHYSPSSKEWLSFYWAPCFPYVDYCRITRDM
jgi:hypothetical protein